jgi:hypothetical protein
MSSLAEFNRYFSIPREPNTVLTPGQFFDYSLPTGKKAIITDIYIENLGTGDASLEILEQRLPASFELRYLYRTKANQVLSLNLSTGLRLGDEAAICDKIRVKNSDTSSGNVLIRVNGQIVG